MIIIMNKFSSQLEGAPKWVGFVLFAIQAALLMWFVGKAINVKDDRLKNNSRMPITKSWWYKRKIKHEKK